MTVSSFNPTVIDPALATRRRTRVAGVVLGVTVPATLLMADLHWWTGFSAWKVLHLFLFAILFSLIVFGAVQATIGFLLRRRGGDRFEILRTLDDDDRSVMRAPTAVIMPICNEEVGRVMEGMRVIYESVRATGQLADCDFFLLSDSSDTNHWIEEEAEWLSLTEKLQAHGRLFYRKRRMGINKKAGNVADFCRRWGSRYRYMVVLDADSIISGDAVAKLVRMMESNPRVGLIQAVPMLANGESILARLQQFASRLYGPIFSSGLNYWQLGEANYWGHNAIIRMKPFIRHCSLPELPGDGPFGGRILSHDYVEAALMRRAGWQVWLATGLEGNYEECPATLVDFAKRDRRWLQGNLQHTRLIVARGFHSVNRIHFLLGILSYVASPLWLAFLLISCVIAYRIDPAARAETIGEWAMDPRVGAISLFTVTIALLFLPKVLSLLDLRRRGEVARFGGWSNVSMSVMWETVIFTLMAPILMLFHTKFVILTLCRQSVSWGTQRRGGAGAEAWREAASAHAGHTLFGIILAIIALRISPALAGWMSPLLIGMIFSIPISVLTGNTGIGLELRRRGLFATPEEIDPPAELRELTAALAEPATGRPVPAALHSHRGLLQAVLDPYVNAAHLSLLRAKNDPPPATALRLAELRDRLVREGPDRLTKKELTALLADVDSMVELHERVWAAPGQKLATWWQEALRHYQIIAESPQTAFTPAA